MFISDMMQHYSEPMTTCDTINDDLLSSEFQALEKFKPLIMLDDYNALTHQTKPSAIEK
jgi:hypothetical protein